MILDYLQSHLNSEQFAAASDHSHHSLILAWAGSGKTRVLTYKIAYLIYWRAIKPYRIMAVTFTNKAAQEMKHRLVAINKECIAAWLTQEYVWDMKRVGTFHGLFLKFLKEEIESLGVWYTSSFGIYDDGESKSIIKRLAWDDADTIKYAISALKSKWISSEKFLRTCEPHEENIALMYDKYQKVLITSNMVDFDDLLLLPYQILSKSSDILEKRQKKFDHILVDEAQDTNWIQFNLMKLLSGKSIISFIWDDYQSIYRRRGAQMENFLQVDTIRKDIKTYKLPINYRSKPHIVDAWHHLIKKNTKQYTKEAFSHRQWSEHIIILETESEMDEAKKVMTLIKETASKTGTYSDVVILYRKNKLSSNLEQVAIAENIPYKIYWWVRFLDRKEIKDMLSYLKYINNPKDTVSLKRIINTPRRWIWPESVEKLEQYARIHKMTMHDVIMNSELLPLEISTKARWGISGFRQLLLDLDISWWPADLIAQLIKKIKYKEYVLESEWKEVSEERMDNIGELIVLAWRYVWTN